MRALAHPDRRLFVAAALDAPRSAGDLAALSSLAAASVSEHLKVLRKARLLELTVDGRSWLYRTNVDLVHRAAKALVRLVSSS